MVADSSEVAAGVEGCRLIGAMPLGSAPWGASLGLRPGPGFFWMGLWVMLLLAEMALVLGWRGRILGEFPWDWRGPAGQKPSRLLGQIHPFDALLLLLGKGEAFWYLGHDLVATLRRR